MTFRLLCGNKYHANHVVLYYINVMEVDKYKIIVVFFIVPIYTIVDVLRWWSVKGYNSFVVC